MPLRKITKMISNEPGCHGHRSAFIQKAEKTDQILQVSGGNFTCAVFQCLKTINHWVRIVNMDQQISLNPKIMGLSRKNNV